MHALQGAVSLTCKLATYESLGLNSRGGYTSPLLPPFALSANSVAAYRKYSFLWGAPARWCRPQLWPLPTKRGLRSHPAWSVGSQWDPGNPVLQESQAVELSWHLLPHQAAFWWGLTSVAVPRQGQGGSSSFALADRGSLLASQASAPRSRGYRPRCVPRNVRLCRGCSSQASPPFPKGI